MKIKDLKLCLTVYTVFDLDIAKHKSTVSERERP